MLKFKYFILILLLKNGKLLVSFYSIMTFLKDSFKRFNFLTWLYLFGGISLLILGIIKRLISNPEPVTNISTQLPFIINGTLVIVLGMGFCIIGFYRIYNQKKLYEDTVRVE